MNVELLEPRGSRPKRAVDAWTALVDVDGLAAGFAWREESGYALEIPTIGVFTFELAGGPVSLWRDEEAPDVEVARCFHHTVVPVVLQARGRTEAFHASAVEVAGVGVVAFPAPSRTGKSTVAHAVARRGHRLWADDAVAFAVDGPLAEPPVATALPFRPALRADVQAALGEAAVRIPRVGEQAPIVHVFVLRRETASRVEAEPMRPAEAFDALLYHAYRLGRETLPKRREMARAYLDLVRRCPVSTLRIPTGLDRLAEIAAAVEARLDARPSAARGGLR